MEAADIVRKLSEKFLHYSKLHYKFWTLVSFGIYRWKGQRVHILY
jgi:hypothetical protein